MEENEVSKTETVVETNVSTPDPEAKREELRTDTEPTVTQETTTTVTEGSD